MSLITSCSVLALVCISCLASRPELELDEVHIATDGHFVKKKRNSSHPHNREHVVREHHQELQLEQNRSGQKQRETADMQRQKLQAADKQKENAKQVFHIDAASHHEEPRSHRWGMLKDRYSYTWSECMPYWICRIAFVAAVLFALLRSSFSGMLLQGWNLSPAKKLQQDAQNEFIQGLAAASQPFDERNGLRPEAAWAKQGLPTVDERLGKAIDERLCEVEQWLRKEADEDNVTEEGSQAKHGEKIGEPQHYQRRWIQEESSALGKQSVGSNDARS